MQHTRLDSCDSVRSYTGPPVEVPVIESDRQETQIPLYNQPIPEHIYNDPALLEDYCELMEVWRRINRQGQQQIAVLDEWAARLNVGREDEV